MVRGYFFRFLSHFSLLPPFGRVRGGFSPHTLFHDDLDAVVDVDATLCGLSTEPMVSKKAKMNISFFMLIVALI